MTALDDLVDDMAGLLDAPCTLEDPDFRLIGFSGQGRAGVVDEVRRHSILERGSTPEVREWFLAHGIHEATGPVRTPADPARGIAARLCIPARHLGRVHGYFWLLEDEHPIGVEHWGEAARIAEAAASLLGLVERRQARRDANYREAVEGHGGAAAHSALELASAAGLDVRDPVACVLVHRPDLGGQLASRSTRSGLVWVREDNVVCAAVVHADLIRSATTLPTTLAALGLGRRLSSLDDSTWVGVGPVVSGLAELAASRTGARVALRVARASERGTVVEWGGLGPLGLLGVARDDDLARTLLTPRLRRFLDEAPGALVETARVYLDEAGSVARAAGRLSVHRQTVYHRLAQIEHLTGCDLSTGEGRLRLHLALRLAPYLG
ncbi:PucR family transcriptional regulator [Cryptosporangium arvum]|uniref:Sugar diacid utilization regulator n=1 Tax=Cryptosporangium arvum DSM 44712 TaxID=927661 RepID=A0A010ZSK1_9ACTN|nr:helix-turn-helix domain-containing protein [Cryptosporangium arvum]EXG81674.1 sugar diacid utilization regulator [Cryptosporangium arvum DSM 44712]